VVGDDHAANERGFRIGESCGAFYDFWGEALEVRLSEPLGARPLFDGSTFPSSAKPYR
jgi:hypothetical protein